jgi:hypothetical protein
MVMERIPTVNHTNSVFSPLQPLNQTAHRVFGAPQKKAELLDSIIFLFWS